MLVENRSAQDHKEMLFGFSILKYRVLRNILISELTFNVYITR